MWSWQKLDMVEISISIHSKGLCKDSALRFSRSVEHIRRFASHFPLYPNCFDTPLVWYIYKNMQLFDDFQDYSMRTINLARISSTILPPFCYYLCVQVVSGSALMPLNTSMSRHGPSVLNGIFRRRTPINPSIKSSLSIVMAFHCWCVSKGPAKLYQINKWFRLHRPDGYNPSVGKGSLLLCVPRHSRRRRRRRLF